MYYKYICNVAYQKHFAKSGGEWMEKMKLPGLRFSRDQMYYLSVAQVCKFVHI